MSRNKQIKELIEKYIDTRKSIYHSIQKEGLSENTKILNQEKQDLNQKIFDLVSDREYEAFTKAFQEAVGMVGSSIPGCSTKEMKAYLENAYSDIYFNCLEAQKNSLITLVDNVVKSVVTILDADNSIMVCNGEYHNGLCNT